MTTARFDLVQVHEEPQTVVEARGEIDATNAPQFQRELAPMAASHPLILDLTPLQYLDSAGFAVLDRILAAGSLRLVISPSSVLRRAAVLMGVPFHDSVDQAGDALGASA